MLNKQISNFFKFTHVYDLNFFQIRMCRTDVCCCCVELEKGGMLWGRVGILLNSIAAVFILLHIAIASSIRDKKTIFQLSYPFIFVILNGGFSMMLMTGIEKVREKCLKINKKEWCCTLSLPFKFNDTYGGRSSHRFIIL